MASHEDLEQAVSDAWQIVDEAMPRDRTPGNEYARADRTALRAAVIPVVLRKMLDAEA